MNHSVSRDARRRFLKTALATTGAGLMSTAWPLRLLASDTLRIGFIYVGARDDFGYNQAHAEGAASIAQLPWIEVIEQENVPETLEVQKTMQSMITLDNVDAVFPTSFGYYDPHVKKVAPRFPDVAFLHCGGLYQEGDPGNAGSYFGYIDEAQYIAGIVAGHSSQRKRLGFVAAKPIPQVLRNINAYTLGARSVDASITTRVVFTGGWSDPVREAEATNSLVDQGVDVVTCHVDSPKVIAQTCAEREIFFTGYHANQSSLIPAGYLTGAEWNWATVYQQYAQWLRDGARPPSLYRGGLKESFVKVSDYGPAVSDAARRHADGEIVSFQAGGKVIFGGGLKDNEGNTVIPANEVRPQTDVRLEKMDWLVEGVVGSTGA